MSAGRERFEGLVRQSSGQVLASLIAHLGDFDLAEEALADAWLLAAENWPRSGFPDNPEAWLFTVAKRRAIDRIRRERQRDDRQVSAQVLLDLRTDDAATELDAELEARDRSGIGDERLRLIFTCCHPALALDAQIALTLKAVGGLTTDELARAFLVPSATIAQRVVRAKRKIRAAGIPYRIPLGHELPDRLRSVMRVVYLVFNEGYAATAGDDLIRLKLADEAIRLGTLLVELMPDEPEVAGLTALMLLHHARRDARVDEAGDLVLLEHQDRSRWHRDEIDRATALLDRAVRRRRRGSYQIQAAIAAVHDAAPTFADTDWIEILALYHALTALDPSPVVALNRCVAVSFVDGPSAALAALDDLDLPNHHLLWASRADFLRNLGRADEAVTAYRTALDLAVLPSEQRFLAKRLDELGAGPS